VGARRGGIVAAALALALGACGGDDGTADTGPTTSRVATTYLVATTVPPPTTPPAPPTGTGTGTSGPAPGTTTTDATGGSAPPVSTGGSGGPPVSGGSVPVSLDPHGVCDEPVDVALVDDLPMDIGATGPVVVVVQQRLEAKGFDVGPSGPDGRFGTQTDAAYRAWERAIDGVETGIVCQEDYDALVGAARRD
jgi:hypothetical protein